MKFLLAVPLVFILSSCFSFKVKEAVPEVDSNQSFKVKEAVPEVGSNQEKVYLSDYNYLRGIDITVSPIVITYANDTPSIQLKVAMVGSYDFGRLDEMRVQLSSGKLLTHTPISHSYNVLASQHGLAHFRYAKLSTPLSDYKELMVDTGATWQLQTANSRETITPKDTKKDFYKNLQTFYKNYVKPYE